MKEKIKKYLEDIFHIQFIVERNYGDFEEYYIKPRGNLNDTFIIKLIIKEDIRITIICEPDIYGRNFLDNINNSKAEQRNIFCEYWKQLGEKKIKLLINEMEYNIDSFMKDNSKWNTFMLKFSKNAYYDEANENKADRIIKYTSLFTAMVLSIVTYEINGYDDEELLKSFIEVSEGTAKQIKSIKYERNPINRQICLANKGYKCSVCGFNFEKKYGIIGKDFIEVHHIVPVSKMGDNYKIDPIKELYPLCSNCHSMIHRKDPPYSIEELKKILYDNIGEKYE